jgi:streptogramin lyase
MSRWSITSLAGAFLFMAMPVMAQGQLVQLPEGTGKQIVEGVPWVACNGHNCLVRIDPKTMAIREYPLPNAKTTVRLLRVPGGTPA